MKVLAPQSIAPSRAKPFAKSLVLLKKEDSVLPLNRNARILVAGKNAHNRGHQCGGFSIAWQGTSGNEFVEGSTSVWEGIREAATGATLSTEASGADADPEQHDIAIVVIGERPYAEGMGDIHSGDHDFHGKLSFSWPDLASDGTDRNKNRVSPLFPPGYGLTYAN